MHGHRARVSSLSWNGPLLSSGGRDSVVMQHDVRTSRDTAETQPRCSHVQPSRAAEKERLRRGAARQAAAVCG